MADIFLSYSHEDRPRAKQFVQLLEARGWSVFWDLQLKPGKHYRRVIHRELEQAGCVIVLWSKHAIRSDWVSDEAEEGRRRDALISVLLDDVEPPLGFRQVQTARIRGWEDDAGSSLELELLFESIRNQLVESAPGSQGLSKSESRPAPVVQNRILPVPQPSVIEKHADTTPVQKAAKPLWPGLTPTLALAAVFVVNWLQTAIDRHITLPGLGRSAGYPVAEAFRWLEGYLHFQAQDVASPWLYKSASFSYFMLYPVLLLGLTVALARRRDLEGYRVFSLAIVLVYLASLPFFLFLPVPERWAFPESGAILLSDRWSDALIEMIRPFSAINNCFPSFHVASMAIAVTICYLYRVRLRTTLLMLAMTVVVSTFALGIHWGADIAAGVLGGVASVFLAWRLVRA